MGQQLVEVAERSNPHAFIVEPACGFADRITGRLAQLPFVRGGSGGKRQRGKRQALHEHTRWLHLRPRTTSPEADYCSTVTTGAAPVSSLQRAAVENVSRGGLQGSRGVSRASANARRWPRGASAC